MTRKGDATSDRPHRRARMIDVPEDVVAVPEESLTHLAAEAPAKAPIQMSPRQSGRRFDIDGWLQASGLEIVKGPEPYSDGRKWTLRSCVFNPVHEKPVVLELAQGALVYKCLHQSCKENDWKAFRHCVDPSYREWQPTVLPVGGTRTRGTERDLRFQPATDTGNAERLVSLYGGDIRYCIETKKWLAWDGRKWASDRIGEIRMRAKTTIRQLYAQAAEIESADIRAALEKHARKSESALGIKAMLTCAEVEEGVAVSARDLDLNPHLLNVNNGTLDLRTGELCDHRRDDLITKMVRFDYRPTARCPKFLKFLNRIMGDLASGSEDSRHRAARMSRYLQKCFGYALTGDVSEKVIFCFFGEGNNGKTTLLDTIRFILSEYSTQVLIDNLMSHSSRESNSSLADLADLQGARFVTTSEAEEGQRLAIGKLKYLSQGMGEIKSCRKYENPIKFTATHKLFVDANHRPAIRGSEKAIWKRLKPVVFAEVIPDAEINITLPEELKLEAEGILAWLVEGCLLWRKEGLGDPIEVVAASDTWQAESDRLSAFIEERCFLCLRDPKTWVPISELWPAFQTWCAENNEKAVLPKLKFDERLLNLGCRQAKKENGHVRVWTGIRFRLPTDDHDNQERDNGTSQDSKN